MDRDKILKTLKAKDFFLKLRMKIHSIFPFYYVRNKNISFQISNSKCYNEISKMYSSIIEEEISESVNESASDKVWICWFQGEDKAPDVVKACINSVRKNMPHKDIIILTYDNIKKYTNFPNYIWKKFEAGNISFAHFSDLLRIELLCEYGGIWIDATVLCTKKIGEINYVNNPLFVFKQLDLIRKDEESIVASSWFISAFPHQRILLLTRRLLWAYWKNHNYLKNYFLFHICFSLSSKRYVDDWEKIPTYNNHTPHMLFFELEQKFDINRWLEIKRQSDFHKLNHHINYNSLAKNSFYNQILNEFL